MMPELKLSQPPKIDGLTDAQIAEYKRCTDEVIARCDDVQDVLMDAGLSTTHALSASSHVMMNAMARQALLTAMMDGREPNREWFLHNCAAAFDRWVGAQSEVPTKENP